ncbi:MAG: tetratricopeptide repeat protein [Kiritimatiellia bacterium]
MKLQNPSLFGLLSILLGLGMAAGCFPPRNANSKTTEQPDVPRPLVIVERGEMDPSGSEGILLRELGRQAVMIAAREGLGARTWDMTLMDTAPSPAATNALTVRLWMSATTNGFKIGLKSVGANGATAQLLERTIETPARQFLDYETLIANLEAMSRSTFVDALKSAGIAPVVIPQSTGHVRTASSGNDALWGSMDVFTHWAALRALHNEIRIQGESSANLAELARGYANMAQMTRFCWNSMDKACMARALLYAQRLMATRPEMSMARAYRAYVRALCERHGPALEDIDAVRKACGGRTNDLPAWLDILASYCRYRTAVLNDRAEKEPNNQLLSLLRVMAVRNARSETVRLNIIQDALKKAPLCSVLYDDWCAVPGVSVGHQATTMSPVAFASTLCQIISRMKILPNEIRELALQGEKQRHDRRGSAGSDVDAKLPGFQDAAIRTNLVHNLYAIGEKDSREPSVAMLGALIESASFVQIQRRFYFMADVWGLPSEEIKTLMPAVKPYIASHPYRAFIESYALNPQRDKSVYTQSMAGLVVMDMKPAMAPIVKVRPPLDINAQSDQIAGDLESRILKQASRKEPDNARELQRDVAELELISPFSPVAVTARIKIDWDQSANRVAAWEACASEQPDIARALALKYRELERYREAERFLHFWADQTRDYSAYYALANNFSRQGQTNEWLATMEDALKNVRDTGLDHADIRIKIALYYMRLGQWLKAVPYAETAAKTWAARAMTCAAQCYEGAGQWAQAEQWVRRNAERYDGERLKWYCWCRRTGQGNASAALAFANKYAATFEASEQTKDRYWAAAFYQLSGDTNKALEIWSKAYTQHRHPYPGLHAVLLLSQLNRSHERDALLKKIVKRADSRTSQRSDLPALNAMAVLFQQYLGGADRLDFDEKAADIVAYSDDADEREYLCYFAGYFYELMGEPELSVAYYERADDLFLPYMQPVYLAGAARQRLKAGGKMAGRPGANLNRPGKYDSAIEFARKKISMMESEFGTNHLDVGDAVYELGNLYYKQGQYAAAGPLYQRALTIWEKALGAGNRDLAVPLRALGLVYYKQGRYAVAEPFFQRALAIREKALDPNHVDAAESLRDLARLYYRQKRYAAAEPLYRRALAILEKARGPDHPDVARVMEDMAHLYGKTGDKTKELEYKERAAKIREKSRK